MEKLSMRRRLTAVRLYLSGLSYDEIASRTKVSKGTVANVVAELKAGRILDVQEPPEQLEALRELAIDLRQHRLSPEQAVLGLAVLSRLQALGVEPAEVDRWVVVFPSRPPIALNLALKSGRWGRGWGGAGRQGILLPPGEHYDRADLPTEQGILALDMPRVWGEGKGAHPRPGL